MTTPILSKPSDILGALYRLQCRIEFCASESETDLSALAGLMEIYGNVPADVRTLTRHYAERAQRRFEGLRDEAVRLRHQADRVLPADNLPGVL
ncbi:MAG TPA: hypothetical protein P5163_00035 [Rubrivivax sp.]|nr:hypothetical protein [Rubrivivax sp.]